MTKKKSNSCKSGESKGVVKREYSEEVIIMAKHNCIGKYSGWETELYDQTYQMLKTRVHKGDSWFEIFTTEVYVDDPLSNEIFVRLVEEKHGHAIKNARHLSTLTGIDEELADELEDTLLLAREYRYQQELRKVISSGGKYQDLLKIDPGSFNLPPKWTGFHGKVMDKPLAIKEAIFFSYSFFESDLFRPAVRDVAEQLEAPYGIVLASLQEYRS